MSEHDEEQPREVLFLVGSGDPLDSIAKREAEEAAEAAASASPDDDAAA